MKFNLQNLSPKNLWYRLTFSQRVSITISIPMICLLLTSGAYFWLRESRVTAQNWVTHTNNVLQKSRDISIDLLTAESSVRGYYLNRQTQFLTSYNQTNVKLPQSVNNLQDSVRDNPMQAQKVREIEQLVRQRLQSLTQGIQLPENSPQIKNQLTIGKKVMEQFNAAMQEFMDEESQLLKVRQDNFDEASNLNSLIISFGTIFSIFGTAVSLRLFKDRELNLRESQSLIQTIVANVVDGVVVIDERSQIESMNNSALKMFGYTDKEEILGKDWQVLIEKDTPEITNRLSQSRGMRSNGSLFPIEISISSIEFDGHRLLVIRDITDRQRIAVQLQSRTDELTRLNFTLTFTNRALGDRNQELDQFAYIVSHDLKAPLRAIANLSEWLEVDLEAQLPEENKLQLQLLRTRVHRMYALLNGILEYARIGRKQMTLELVSVEALIAEIVDTLSPPTGFIVEYGSPLPTFITARILLGQVFSNLIDNAIKYHPNPSQGKIVVSMRDLEEYYEFTVSDNGEGIDPKFHQKVFTIFQTLEARDIRESTGVGLAIVKKIVETEGGKINLTSELNQGSIFNFSWRKSFSEQIYAG